MVKCKVMRTLSRKRLSPMVDSLNGGISEKFPFYFFFCFSLAGIVEEFMKVKKWFCVSVVVVLFIVMRKGWPLEIRYRLVLTVGKVQSFSPRSLFIVMRKVYSSPAYLKKKKV